MSGPATPESVVVRAEPPPRDAHRPLRRDAERNRERILTAAAELFAEQGLDVGVDDIARRAGVGMGTLYRRFPNKEALVDEILLSVVERSRSVAEVALATCEPGDELRWFVVNSIDSAMIQHVFLSSQMWTGRIRDLLYAQVIPLMSEMYESAKAVGALRLDIAFTDLLVLIRALRVAREITEAEAPGTWHRYVTLMFDGLRPGAADRPLEPAPIDPAVLRYASRPPDPA
jgi:AcrR family transcriptional regulator